VILDTSAIIAVLRDEPEAAAMAQAMEQAGASHVSAVSYVEAAIVIDSSRSPVSSRRFDDFFRQAHIVIESVSPEHARIAREAYRDFGKGRHRAGLNFGDCFSYALAKERGETLLFKGDDFCQTDIEAADVSGLGGIRDE
jgi:ribonuclease VapC